LQQMREAELSSAAAAAKVYGEGAHEFTVLVTAAAPASRMIRVHADHVDDAIEAAESAAVEEQVAHFLVDEGNFIRRDQIHSTMVLSASNEVLWEDCPAENDLAADSAAPKV
jgi:hypothetical protein